MFSLAGDSAVAAPPAGGDQLRPSADSTAPPAPGSISLSAALRHIEWNRTARGRSAPALDRRCAIAQCRHPAPVLRLLLCVGLSVTCSSGPAIGWVLRVVGMTQGDSLGTAEHGTVPASRREFGKRRRVGRRGLPGLNPPRAPPS